MSDNPFTRWKNSLPIYWQTLLWLTPILCIAVVGGYTPTKDKKCLPLSAVSPLFSKRASSVSKYLQSRLGDFWFLSQPESNCVCLQIPDRHSPCLRKDWPRMWPHLHLPLRPMFCLHKPQALLAGQHFESIYHLTLHSVSQSICDTSACRWKLQISNNLLLMAWCSDCHL